MKLKKNDHIRVIAPSRSMVILSEDTIGIAKETLENMGLSISFGKNVMKSDEDFLCAPVNKRVEDLHEAFLDKEVNGILTVIGGYNVNQILPKIDYELIKKNPKIICGYSDITALLTAIYAKTGMVTFLGPHYSTFGMKKGNEYTIDYFKKIMFKNTTIKIESSPYYSDDEWYIDQEKRVFIKSSGMKVLNPGKAKGTIIGGNLCTLNLLQGTEYMPNIKDDIILFIEDDGESDSNFIRNFDRDLVSLTQIDLFKQVKGIIVGRSQENCVMNDRKWKKILTKDELKDLVIVYDANFGHTMPLFTIPIGGKCTMNCQKGKIDIRIGK